MAPNSRCVSRLPFKVGGCIFQRVHNSSLAPFGVGLLYTTEVWFQMGGPDIFLDGYTRRAKPRDSLNSLGLIHPREAFGLLSL